MELRLDKKLYSLEGIKETVEAFGEFAKIEIQKGDKKEHKIIFTEIDDDIGEAITDEFANFALGMTIEERGE
jgi:hypothetical protein